MLTYSTISFHFGYLSLPFPSLPPHIVPTMVPLLTPPVLVPQLRLTFAQAHCAALSQAAGSSVGPGRGGACACAVRGFGAGQAYIRRRSADALHCRQWSQAAPCIRFSSWPASWARVSPGTPNLRKWSPAERGPLVLEQAVLSLVLLPLGAGEESALRRRLRELAGRPAEKTPSRPLKGTGSWRVGEAGGISLRARVGADAAGAGAAGAARGFPARLPFHLWRWACRVSLLAAALCWCWAHMIEMDRSPIQLDTLWPLASVAPQFLRV